MTARERRRRRRRRRKICMASLIERNAAQTDGERATHRQTGARAVANEHLPPLPAYLPSGPNPNPNRVLNPMPSSHRPT